MTTTLRQFDLSGRVGLVTGAAGLLGVEHAHALAESGAVVVLTDVNEDALTVVSRKLAAAYGNERILARHMDVTNEDSVCAVYEELCRSLMEVSILVNNAAIDPKVRRDAGMAETSRLENFSLEQWNFQIDVGLTGAFRCAKVFGAAMADRGSGTILNIASDLAVIAPDQRLYRKPGLSEDMQPVKPVTYSVIKAGLVGLTRYLATYWADRGVRCNALSPGGVYNQQDEGFVSRLSALIPMGRMARCDEYRGAVQFLCSDASSYLNGQNIVIDGGRSVW